MPVILFLCFILLLLSLKSVFLHFDHEDIILIRAKSWLLSIHLSTNVMQFYDHSPTLVFKSTTGHK